ncbi:MFS transporter [Mycobacterium intracellulare]|uniref:MFS transporter n=1 Tax=Mycobacterium intracellulare TaxID=1767 RepID=UPI000C7C8C54|nr:MFS transporter [Mycobacterium intracellulare]
MKQTLSKFESESVRTHSRRAAIAAAAGNVLEGYDIGIYGYSAVILAKLFFSDNGTGALILTFAVFASGYLTKPLGAVLFGHIGDRYGRRLALVTSVLLIGICTVLIGVLPTQASIGISAPILLTILRLLQGIAAGGESSGSAIFMVESAPPAHRGLYGSWQQVSTAGGLLLSSGAIGVLSAVFTQEEIFVWAWRIPFLLAIFTTLGALWLRLGVEETPTFEALEKSDAVVHNPLMVSIKKFWREIVVTIGSREQ